MADWKDVVRTVAPALATAFGTPAMGVAVSALGNVLLGDANASEEAVEAAVMAGMSPDAMIRLKELDQQYALENRRIDLQNKQTEYQNDQVYITDTQDARHNNAQSSDVFHLGIAVLCIYGLILLGSLYGSFAIITGGIILKDVATVGMVSTFIGTVIGAVGSMAGQVISFYFGSSKGSDRKTDQMVEAFKTLK